MFERLIGLIGIFVLLATAFLLSNNRSKINYRTVGWGFGLQFIFAFLIDAHEYNENINIIQIIRFI